MLDKKMTSIVLQKLSEISLYQQKTQKFLSVFLWGVIGVFSIAKLQFDANYTGVTLVFSILDLILIGITTGMILKGFERENILMIIPWILLSTVSVYMNRSQIIPNTKVLRKITRNSGTIFMFTTNLLLTVTRIIQILYVTLLCLKIWMRKASQI